MPRNTILRPHHFLRTPYSEYGLSFGFRYSQSIARNTLKYPEGFLISSQSFDSGKLEGRIFYLGAKKQFFLDAEESWSVAPHLGFSYNPFFFDNTVTDNSTGAQQTFSYQNDDLRNI